MGPGSALREDTPWERRKSIGWVSGLFQTWKQTLLSPQHFWASVKPNGSWTDALLYGWIFATLGVLLGFFLDSLRGSSGLQAEQLAKFSPELRAFIQSYASGGGNSLFAIVLYPLVLIIGAALHHLFCMLFGVAKHGYFATLRVVAYTSGALALFSAIHAHGLLSIAFCVAVFIYWLVLEILGLASVQESSLGRAAAAVLVPFALCCCCASLALTAAVGGGIFALLKGLQNQ